jgi:Alpha amylase, catalytic domain
MRVIQLRSSPKCVEHDFWVSPPSDVQSTGLQIQRARPSLGALPLERHSGIACVKNMMRFLSVLSLFLVLQPVAAFASEWYDHAVIYEIYPRSFQDSNDDGIGDLKGIKRRLGYLKELGVDAIWITPLFPEPECRFRL